MIIDSDDYVGRLHWIRSDRNVQASVILRERKGKGRKRGKPKQLVVIVPAAWKFIEKVEKVRDETPGDQICELIANWDYISVFQECGLLLTEDLEGPDKATYTYRPLIKNLWEMADESLKSISQALERLALTQSSSSWSRHMKTPDLFKPDTRDNEIKQWSDWKFSFVNYIKGIDARMAASMELVEENLNGDFKLGDMTDETKMMAVRLYGVLTSYLRNRPLKLVKFMKDENGFEAWQRLLKEMQPATRARSLALLTQLSRVQFAEGRTLSEQLPPNMRPSCRSTNASHTRSILMMQRLPVYFKPHQATYEPTYNYGSQTPPSLKI